jgi:lysozyme
MDFLEGVDVSHHNGVIDWERAREVGGISFAIIKATQGSSFVDALAERNVTKCREFGIVPTLYHFYRHDVDPDAQAEHFIKRLALLQADDLIPAIDVETDDDGGGEFNYSQSEVVRRVGVVVRAVQEKIGRAPMIYTYPAAWKELTGNTEKFAGQCPLWIASYRETPKLVGGWEKFGVWQWTDQGKVKGIGSGVDRDRIQGTMADLDAFRLGHIGAPVRLETGGEAMFNQDGKVREAPGTDAAEVAILNGGTAVSIIEGPEQADGRDWWRIDDGRGTIGWSSSLVLSPA